MNLSIVTFKWKKSTQGYKLKTKVQYGPEHVNILFRSIKRNTSISFTPICVTDDPEGIDADIKIIPLWDIYNHLGGCYNRLWIFSKEARDLFGEKLVCIDLDCVITGNIDSILSREEDFIINEFRPNNQKQKYNGGLLSLVTGSRIQVWEEFNQTGSTAILDDLRKSHGYIGSDQAWIQYVLGENQDVFTNQDGVYDFKQFYDVLPADAKIILFPGKSDPSLAKEHTEWIKNHWKI